MSASSSSSSSSSSSASSISSEDDNNGNGGGPGPGPGPITAGTSGGDHEGPSTYRRRYLQNEVWPEPFIEALAAQVAIEASRSVGCLAAAAALANVFQVCSSWRAVSQSELLWHRLTRRLWRRTNLLHDTWRDEYMYWHRTARNFRTARSAYTRLHFVPDINDEPDGLICRCLTLSDLHIACGFINGVVRLFDLNTHVHVRTYRPSQRNRLGQFARAVSGIVISNSRLTFATLDGDIYVAIINGPAQPRQARLGDVVTNGALVDFSGCGRWWVGLYAGVPGQAFHIWDAHTEEPIFVGGTLTDPVSLLGWHMLTELTEVVGRVRVTRDSAVACTRLRLILFNPREQGMVLGEEESRRGLIVPSLDVSQDAYMVVDSRGLARVRRLNTLEEICRFIVRGFSSQSLMGCMNLGHALIWTGSEMRVWEVEHGEYLYSMREAVGEVNAMVANNRHVAASCNDTTIHLWDFGDRG